MAPQRMSLPRPGKHWTQYDDNTTIWWCHSPCYVKVLMLRYYEGPKGTWWLGPEHNELKPQKSMSLSS